MDVFIPIVIFILVFILFSICGFCCKRKRQGTVYGLAATNVTVSTQPISASPVVVPPYPVEPRHPTPHTVPPAPHAAPPAPGFAANYPGYPSAAPVYYGFPMGNTPYPQAAGATPYPPVSNTTPYPPGPPALTTPYPPNMGNTASSGPSRGTSAPYPDYDYGAQPPSYSEAISQPPVQPLPSKEGYSKQAPYNPNY